MPKRESGFLVGNLFNGEKGGRFIERIDRRVDGLTGCPDCTISTC
jgi:hypothetical protein